MAASAPEVEGLVEYALISLRGVPRSKDNMIPAVMLEIGWGC